ncbi:hypothetical protein B0O80DRAFT_443550 [Mortierella sp. GBAus27b]|nr:hypothetical protein B0O80DRAFT_443550 [Mortierella sp. GBAus27b]
MSPASTRNNTRLTIDTNIANLNQRRLHNRSATTNSSMDPQSVFDMIEPQFDDARRAPVAHREHPRSHNHETEPRNIKAEDLSLRLQRLKQEQEGWHNRNQSSSSSSSSSSTTATAHAHTRAHSHTTTLVHVDATLHKQAHETIHEILDRLERQRMESDTLFRPSSDHSYSSGTGTLQGAESNEGRMRHTHKLNPNLFAGELAHTHSLRQSHGNANLRHS